VTNREAAIDTAAPLCGATNSPWSCRKLKRDEARGRVAGRIRECWLARRKHAAFREYGISVYGGDGGSELKVDLRGRPRSVCRKSHGGEGAQPFATHSAVVFRKLNPSSPCFTNWRCCLNLLLFESRRRVRRKLFADSFVPHPTNRHLFRLVYCAAMRCTSPGVTALTFCTYVFK